MIDEERLLARVAVLERQMFAARTRIHELEEWLDTVNSLPWKRLWWLLQGFRWYRVGRWRG